MRSLMLAIGVLVVCQFSLAAQGQTGTVRVQVHAAQKPIEDAEVVVAGTSHRTDASGSTTVVTGAGKVDISVVKDGFVPVTTSVQVGAGATQEVIVELQQQPSLEESVTVVASTRTNKRLEDQPMRVEVLEREEIEEKMLMTPGDIVMMLNEMGGMRVQTTSPSLGAASVRIQGMRGRYTRVLSDGLPLFGEVGGLGLLQIPPMDLGQVEVIKGVASALYGAGAMGGVINLLSRVQAPNPRKNSCSIGPHGARLMRSRFFLVPSAADGAVHCSVAAIGRRPTTSTTMHGPISRAIREGSCGRACFGTAAVAERSLPQLALPTRIARVGRRMARCWRRRTSRMLKPSRRDATTPVPWDSSSSRTDTS
jgi:hypothetical protein